MEQNSLRAADVASKLHMSERTVTRWLKGTNQPTRTAAHQLGDLFNVDWRIFRADPS